MGDAMSWRNAMRRQRGGPVPVGVMRDRKSLTISFVVPKQTGQAITVESEITAHLNMDELQADLNGLRPEIEAAQRQAAEAQKQLWKQNADFRKQAAQAAKDAEREVQSHQREIQKQAEQAAEDARREVLSHQREIQDQAQRAAEEARRQMQLHRNDLERLQQEMQQWKHKAAEM